MTRIEDLCPTIEKSVLFEDYYYATLDGTPPDHEKYGRQDQFLELPEGWQIVPNETAIIDAVVAKHNWGAHVLVLRDGTAWSSRYYHTAGTFFGEGFLLKNGKAFRPDLQAVSPMATLPLNFGRGPVAEANRRILVRKALRVPWSATEHCSSLLRGLWSDRRFCDCEIACGEVTVACHRAVLAQASPVFERMLSSDMLEGQRQRIEIKEAEPQVVRALLMFLYLGELECSDFAPGLMRLADFYQVDALVGLCAEKALDSVTNENISDVARALRALQDRPEIPNMWGRLVDKVRDDTLLFSAVMQQL